MQTWTLLPVTDYWGEREGSDEEGYEGVGIVNQSEVCVPTKCFLFLLLAAAPCADFLKAGFHFRHSANRL